MHPSLISDRHPVVVHEGRVWREQHGRAVCLGAEHEVRAALPAVARQLPEPEAKADTLPAKKKEK